MKNGVAVMAFLLVKADEPSTKSMPPEVAQGMSLGPHQTRVARPLSLPTTTAFCLKRRARRTAAREDIPSTSTLGSGGQAGSSPSPSAGSQR